MDDNRIKRLLSLWIPALFTCILSAFAAWANSINNDVIDMRIAQAEITTLIEGIDERLKESIDNGKKYEDLRNKLISVQLQSQINADDLLLRRGIHFNMPDYDKYIRPIQNDLLQRVTKVEVRIDNK